MKHNILYLTHHSEIGGGETSLIYLCQKLNKQVFIPHVVVPAAGQVSQRLENFHIQTNVLPLSGFLWQYMFLPGCSPASFRQLYRIIKQIKPALIHVNNLNLSVYAGILGRIFKIPVVATAHGTWDSIYFYNDLATRFCSNLILAVSPEISAHITRTKIIPKRKVVTIPYGVDVSYFVPAKNKALAKMKLSVRKHDLVVSMVCRFDFTKNHITFLKTANRIIQKLDNVRFLIAGDWERNLEADSAQARAVKRQLDQFLRSHPQLKRHVRFTGYQPDVLPVLQATDILFSSSLSETLPVSFLEGGACGLPLIALENTSTAQIIQDSVNGYLVPRHQPQKLYTRLLELLINGKLRTEMGKQSRLHIERHFSLATIARKVEQVYCGLIA